MTVSRIVPATGPGLTVFPKLKEEIEALWKASSCPLVSVTGTNTITANCLYPLDARTAGQKFTLIPANTSTGAVTLEIDGKGALPLRDEGGVALGAGRLTAGKLVQVIDAGTEYRLLGGSGGAGGATLLRAVFALVQPRGTHGGSVTGSARTRYPFNTVILNDIPGLSLDTTVNIGRITVPAMGFERIDARCLFDTVGRAGLYLRDLSGGGSDITSGIVRSQSTGSGHARVSGKATFGSSRDIEVQYFTSASQATTGLGTALNEAGLATEHYGFIEFQTYG